MKRFHATGSIFVLAAALAGCAPQPPRPEPPQAEPTAAPIVREDRQSPARAALVVRHLELAARARDAGDLATVADHEEVVVLVAPDEPRHRKALQATRDAIRRGVREHGQAGIAARRSGDFAAAREAFLRVLFLDPDNADATKALRETEAAAMARTQSERAARARSADDVIANARVRAANDAYDLEQRLELVRAGDLQAGVRELRAWADANPNDRAGRQRASAIVAERARDLDGKGQREAALSLYEQAAAINGRVTPEWSARMQALRKGLGEHYYAEGMKMFRTDLASAVRHFEAGARHDPSNAKLQAKLRAAKVAQRKLERITEK